jgi:hypothetical protein
LFYKRVSDLKISNLKRTKEVHMTADTLSSICGALLSLTFSYFPGAADWFNRQDGTRKRLVMLGLLALTSLAAFGLSCTPWAHGLGIPLACSQEGALGLLRTFVLAVVANQSTYLISPRPNNHASHPQGPVHLGVGE